MAKDSPIFIDVGQGLALPIGQPTISTGNTPGRPKKPMKGTFGFNSQTNSLELWNGFFWLFFL